MEDKRAISTVFDFVNEKLGGKTPSQIVLLTLGSTYLLYKINATFSEGRLIRRSADALFRGFRSLASPIIRSEVKKVAKGFKMPQKEGEFKSLALPEAGLGYDKVLALLSEMHENLDVPYEEGGFSGAVYHGGAEYTTFINEAMNMFQWSNPLHSDIFGATRKMEAEVVSMVLHMFNGHLLPDAAGCVTSGGTESIVMALKTYRDWGRATRGIKRPSIIAPQTIHTAFDKGCLYFDIELIKVPVDPVTGRVDPVEVEKYIRYDTVAIAASAPNFPHGVVDPIEELAEVAYRNNVGMHVDCCLGGFIMPFMEKTGRKVPCFDFRNRGVTSISCDTHKYGYAPKGTSTIMYRSRELRAYQFCCLSEWPGGLYCSPAVSGSKPGNVIAATWAAMVSMGLDGYVECCDKIVSTREKMTSALAEMPFLYIIGEPTASVFAFGSNVIDVFQLGTQLKERGWVLNFLQYPSGLQFSITMLQTNEGVADRFIKDVAEVGQMLSDKAIKMLSEGKRVRVNTNSASVYGTAQRIPDPTIIMDVLKEYLTTYYSA